MTADKHIVHELRELSPTLADLRNTSNPQTGHPYTVPAGYFDQFANSILLKIRQMEVSRRQMDSSHRQLEDSPADAREEISNLSPLLAGLSRKMPFEVPDGYFKNVPVPQSESEPEFELEPGSPLLTISKAGPYQVPDQYFEQFPDTLLKKLKEPKEPARVIAIGRRWVKYAAAAVVAGVIAVAGWLYSGKDIQNSSLIAAMDKHLEEEMAEISEEAMLEYTNPTSTIYYGLASALPEEISDYGSDDLLEDISDDALQQYVQEYDFKMNGS